NDPTATPTRIGFAALLVLASLVGTTAAFKAHFESIPNAPYSILETPATEPIPVPQRIPPPAPGRVRVYRGVLNGDPDTPQVGAAYRDNPESAPSGGTNFLSDREAYQHAFGNGSENGISVTTDEGTANQYGPNAIIYDVPKDVFDRLPIGDPTQAERVFGYSIPREYKVGTIRPK